MTTWVAVLAVAAGSYAMRALPLFVLGRVPLSPRVEDMLRRAGLAAITALVALSARSQAAAGDLSATLAALAGATVLAVRKASMLRIVGVGGAIYAAVQLGSAGLG